MTCSICLEENTNYKLRVCGHKFHDECIFQWIKIKPICPLCRAICINSFPYTYKNLPIKKGDIIIKNNLIVLKHNDLIKNSCQPKYKTIPFISIKRIEHNHLYFKITYIKNFRSTIKKIYTHNPVFLFNLCKYHLFNNNYNRVFSI